MHLRGAQPPQELSHEQVNLIVPMCKKLLDFDESKTIDPTLVIVPLLV